VKPISAELRAEQKLPATGMAYKVQHVGQFAPHDGAKKAGFLANDIVVSYDGHTDLARETDLLAYSLNVLKPGATPTVAVLRDGKRLSLTLPVGP
jgi:S1-C subfamily serine protease